jgi:ABC-2 type transport system ATP-binding protein
VTQPADVRAGRTGPARTGPDPTGPGPRALGAGTGLAVATTGLTKRFGHQVAVNAIDLRVPGGAVYGFLGPNGSGKTTTIRMLLGLVTPTAGSIELLGQQLPAGAGRALPRVGSLVEGPAFHPYLSGRANLSRLDAADRYADPRTAERRIDAALDRLELNPEQCSRLRA